MNARACAIASRTIRPSTQCLVRRMPMQRRFASSEKQPSHISQFYKTFTRPVAKVLLMAFFTYQLAYWTWVKLEQDEIIAQREAYIAELEDEVAWLADHRDLDAKIAADVRRANGGEEPTIQFFQIQLMELEQQNKERAKAMAQAEIEAKKGQETTGQKKASPWWKVW